MDKKRTLCSFFLVMPRRQRRGKRKSTKARQALKNQIPHLIPSNSQDGKFRFEILSMFQGYIPRTLETDFQCVKINRLSRSYSTAYHSLDVSMISCNCYQKAKFLLNMFYGQFPEFIQRLYGQSKMHFRNALMPLLKQILELFEYIAGFVDVRLMKSLRRAILDSFFSILEIHCCNAFFLKNLQWLTRMGVAPPMFLRTMSAACYVSAFSAMDVSDMFTSLCSISFEDFEDYSPELFEEGVCSYLFYTLRTIETIVAQMVGIRTIEREGLERFEYKCKRPSSREFQRISLEKSTK